MARGLARRFEPCALVEGDAFFGFIERGAITPWLSEASEQNEVVTQAAAAAAGRYAAGGFVTVYDGMVGPWFLQTFLRATGLERVDYAMLMPSVERYIERVASRQDHGFRDEGATRHMYRQFARADIDERHVLVDPPDDSNEVADMIVAALEQELLAYRRRL